MQYGNNAFNMHLRSHTFFFLVFFYLLEKCEILQPNCILRVYEVLLRLIARLLSTTHRQWYGTRLRFCGSVLRRALITRVPNGKAAVAH